MTEILETIIQEKEVENVQIPEVAFFVEKIVHNILCSVLREALIKLDLFRLALEPLNETVRLLTGAALEEQCWKILFLRP